MAINSAEKKQLLAPLMDRLIGGHSGQNKQPQAVLTQIRESVRRDLEALMNSRCSIHSPDAQYTLLQKSLLNYGLPDLSTINFASKKDTHDFCRAVEKTIEQYEPRVKSIKVTTAKKIDLEDPTVHFRVEAVLWATAAKETLVFDSAFNPVSYSVNISESL